MAGMVFVSAGGKLPMLMETDADGDRLWLKMYNPVSLGNFDDNQVLGITVCRDGGYAMVGMHFRNSDVFDKTGFLIRTDAEGNELWRHVFTSGGLDSRVSAIAQTFDGGFIIAAGHPDAVMAKTDSAGTVLWTRSVPAAQGTDLLEMPNGAYILSGLVYSTPSALFVAAYSQNGDSLWYREYAVNGSLWTSSVCQGEGGGFVLAANSNLLGIDATGTEIWRVTVNSFYTNFVLDVFPAATGGYIGIGEGQPNGPEAWQFFATRVGWPSAVDRCMTAIPVALSLSAFPNPFNASSVLAFTLPQAGHAVLTLHDILGREVRRLVDDNFVAGTHTVALNAQDMGTGIYFAALQSGKSRMVQKLVLLK